MINLAMPNLGAAFERFNGLLDTCSLPFDGIEIIGQGLGGER